MQQSPFVQNHMGHPSFNPSKPGTREARPNKPRQPEKPAIPYERFKKRVYEGVKAANSELRMGDINKLINQMWHDLADIEKSKYQIEYDNDRIEYAEAMRIYQNSSAYKSWVAASSRGTEEQLEIERREHQDTRYSIQPADDETIPQDEFSVKHLATIRFRRNHWLMSEIFNEVQVPPMTSYVSNQRLDMLKGQVGSLMTHLENIQSGIEDSQKKHELRKRKFIDESQSFQEKYQKLLETPLETLRENLQSKQTSKSPKPAPVSETKS